MQTVKLFDIKGITLLRKTLITDCNNELDIITIPNSKSNFKYSLVKEEIMDYSTQYYKTNNIVKIFTLPTDFKYYELENNCSKLNGYYSIHNNNVISYCNYNQIVQ